MAERSPHNHFARRNHGSSARARRAPIPQLAPVGNVVAALDQHDLAKRGGCGFLWMFDCPTSTAAPSPAPTHASTPPPPPPAPRPAPAPAPETTRRTTTSRTQDGDDRPVTVTTRRTVTQDVTTRLSTTTDASGHPHVITAVLTAQIPSNNTHNLTLELPVSQTATPLDTLPTSTIDPAQSAAASSSTKSESSEPNAGAVAGAVVGALTFITIFALVLVWIWHKRSKRRHDEDGALASRQSQYMAQTKRTNDFVQFQRGSPDNSMDDLDEQAGRESRYLNYASSSRPRSFVRSDRAPEIPPVPPMPAIHSPTRSNYGAAGIGSANGPSGSRVARRPAYEDDESHYADDDGVRSTRAPTWNIRMSQISAYSDEALPASGNQYSRRA